jgi:hypothetical protein
MGTIEKNYFVPVEFDEENGDFHEYLDKIYGNRESLYEVP